MGSCMQPHTSQAISQLVKSGVFPSFGAPVQMLLHGFTSTLEQSLHAQKPALLPHKGNAHTEVGKEPSYVSQVNQNPVTVRSTVLLDYINFSELSAKTLRLRLRPQFQKL